MDDDEIETEVQRGVQGEGGLEASRESATVAELAARHDISPPPDFRLEAAADRERGGVGTKNPQSKAARGMNVAPRPMIQLTMGRGFI